MGFTSSRKQAILELVTKLKTDDPSQVERLSGRFRDLQKEATGARDRLKLLVGGLKEEHIELSRATEKALAHSKVINGVGQAADNAAKKLNFYNQAVRNSYGSNTEFLKGRSAGAAPGGGRGSSGGINVERGLMSIGQLLPGGAGNAARTAADLAQLTEEIGKFSQATGIAHSSLGKAVPALSALNTPIAALGAGLIAAAALAALALAIGKFVKDINEAQETLTSATDAQVKYYELIKTGTSEEIQVELERARIAKEAREAVLAQLEAEQARLGLLGEIAKVFGIGPAKEIERLNKEISNLNFEIDPLQRALGSTEVKTRDAARAAEKAAEEVTKQAQETNAATQAIERQNQAQEKAAQQANQLAVFYENLTANAQQASDEAKKAEFDLQTQRLKIIESYNQRILDAEVQNQRNLAREQRRADFDRMIALKQRELQEFDLLLRGDFAGVGSLRRGAQVQDEIDRARGEFEANERLIAEREQDLDNQLALQRQLSELTSRYNSERAQSQQDDLAYMRAQVAEWFKLKGYMGDVSRLSEEQIRRFYQMIVGVGASAGSINFGQRLGGTPTTGQSAVTQPTSSFGGGFQATGGFGATTVNANFNINNANDPRAVAREVNAQLQRVIRG